MTEAKHTPGPWTVFYKQKYEEWHVSVPAFGMRLALFPDGIRTENHEADARLIAAAPELLEASMKVLEWFEAEDDHSKADFYQRMQMCRDAEEMIRAAIAKATGN